MAIETALAKGSLDRDSRRDPEKIYHRMPTQGRLAGDGSIVRLGRSTCRTLGAPAIKTLNVAVPEFFKQWTTLIKAAALEDLKTYLTWHSSTTAAPLLPRFRERELRILRKALTGSQGVAAALEALRAMDDGDLGEALGKKYVEKTFGEKGKRTTLEMVQASKRRWRAISSSSIG